MNWTVYEDKYLLHCAIHSKGLVDIGGLAFGSTAPDNHVTSHIKFLLILNLLSSAIWTLSKLPGFLPNKNKTCQDMSAQVMIVLIKVLKCWSCDLVMRRSYRISLMKSDLLKGPHEPGRAIWGPQLRRRLQLSQLDVNGVRVIFAVLTTERDKRLQFPSGYHCGSLFIDVRHEFPISALFLQKFISNVNSLTLYQYPCQCHRALLFTFTTPHSVIFWRQAKHTFNSRLSYRLHIKLTK